LLPPAAIAGAPLLAVWVRRDRAAYFDLEAGAGAGEAGFVAPVSMDRAGLDWANFISDLTAPNGAAHTLYRTPRAVLRLTHDKRWRLYRDGAAELTLHDNAEARLAPLDAAGAKGFLSVRFAPAAEVTAALDEAARLLVYRGFERVGAYPTGLALAEGGTPSMCTSDDGVTIYLTDRRALVAMTAEGRVLARVVGSGTLNRLACSPDGRYLLANDLDGGVLRAFEGGTLRQTHQRFVVDLLEEARQLQLIADWPPQAAAVSALAVDDAGRVAFAVAGAVCVCRLDAQFQRLPGSA
jgi:hypothetical protein